MENVFKEALKIAALLLMSASFIHAGQNDSVDMQTIDYVDDEDDANTSLVEDIVPRYLNTSYTQKRFEKLRKKSGRK